MKKLIIIISITAFAVMSYGQTGKYIWQLTNQATAASGYYVAVSDASWNETKKMTIAVLTSLEQEARENMDDTIQKYAGLEADGTWDAPDGANYINDAGFASIGLDENISNAAFLLDSVINAGVYWEDGGGLHSTCLKNSHDSTAGAYSVSIGRYSESDTTSTFTHGEYAITDWYAGRSFASGSVHEGVNGSSEGFEVCMYSTTTNATADTLKFGDVLGSYFSVPNDAAITFTLEIIAIQAGGAVGDVGDTWSGKYGGCIKNIALTTSLCGDIDTLRLDTAAGADHWQVIVSADDTEDALIIQVTGEASHTIYWAATLRGIMVGVRNFNID